MKTLDLFFLSIAFSVFLSVAFLVLFLLVMSLFSLSLFSHVSFTHVSLFSLMSFSSSLSLMSLSSHFRRKCVYKFQAQNVAEFTNVYRDALAWAVNTRIQRNAEDLRLSGAFSALRASVRRRDEGCFHFWRVPVPDLGDVLFHRG